MYVFKLKNKKMGEKRAIEEIFSKSVRAGRRTYFFDVRSTRAGDYYLTMTESKRDFNEDGTPFYKKHKIYLYKEDFGNFKNALAEMTDYIIKEKGEDIISLHKPEVQKEKTDNSEDKEEDKVDKEKTDNSEDKEEDKVDKEKTDFTEVSFDDLEDNDSSGNTVEEDKKDRTQDNDEKIE